MDSFWSSDSLVLKITNTLISFDINQKKKKNSSDTLIPKWLKPDDSSHVATWVSKLLSMKIII